MTELVIEPTLDANLLSELHAETVTFAYSGFFPADAPPPTVEQLRVTWTERLADATATALAAWQDGRPAGSVMVRRDPDFPGEGQLLGLHVRPDAWDRGIGSALLNRAVNTLLLQGYLNAGLWVIAENDRAQQMYSSNGWKVVPNVELNFLGVTELRYRLSLST